MKRRLVYILATTICFIICLLIVLLLSHNQFIRGFIGDVVVIILIYCFIKIFVEVDSLKLSISILLFSVLLEILQYLKFINYIGLGQSKVAKIIIGTTFDFRDLLAYVLGTIIVYLLDTKLYDYIKKRQECIAKKKFKNSQ
ncbi:hypothetical protein AN1V17_16650 [Vallitalea sediminicola]